MDYSPQKVSEQNEIGKNLSVLPAKLNKQLYVNDSVTIESLLSFKENYVANLYNYDPTSQLFKFEHRDGEYVAKANAKLEIETVDFTAEYIEGIFTEYGISYVGVIKIEYTDISFYISIPGELSYDPASEVDDKIWVDSQQVNKLVVFLCILVKAALLGANSKFLRRLYTVTKPIISKYYKKKELFKWIYTQVRNTCLKKKPSPTYAEFLGTRNLINSENVKSYLSSFNQLKDGHIQEILPPDHYFLGIKNQNDLINNAKDSINDKIMNDEPPVCFSPDIDDESTPSIQEILEDLKKVRNKYETELLFSLKKTEKLEIAKSSNREIFTAEKTFKSQCPIF